jgi:hypothetical protein
MIVQSGVLKLGRNKETNMTGLVPKKRSSTQIEQQGEQLLREHRAYLKSWRESREPSVVIEEKRSKEVTARQSKESGLHYDKPKKT